MSEPKPFLRGQRYYLRYTTIGGNRRTVSLGTTSLRRAEAAARKILDREDEARAGVVDPIRLHARTAFSEHVEAWERSLRCSARQRKDLVRTVTLMAKHQGLAVLRDLTRDACDAWLGHRQDLGLSVTRLNHHRAHLRQFSRWLAETDRVKVDPLRRLARFAAAAEGEPDGLSFDRRALDDDELRRLLEHAPEPRRSVYLVAVTTGLRRGELAQLRWDSVDLEARQLTVLAGTTKNRRTAHLPLTAGAVEALQGIRDRAWVREELDRLRLVLAAARSESAAARELGCSRSTMHRRLDRLGKLLTAGPTRLVWPGGRWCYPDGRGPGIPTVPRLHSDLVAAGVEPENDLGLADFHALRTTFGTALARAGVPLVVAQRLMRHSSPDLTARYYTRVRSSDQREAVAAVWRGLAEAAVEGGTVTRLEERRA